MPTTLRAEIATIITTHSTENAAVEILALFEDRGFSLIGNGWLDDDKDAIKQINAIAEERDHPRFEDIPVGTFFIHDGFFRKTSDAEARKVDFLHPDVFTDDRPIAIDPESRVNLARGLNKMHGLE